MTLNERKSIPIWRRLILLTMAIFIFSLQIGILALMFQLNYSNWNWVFYLIIEVIGLCLVMHIIHKPIVASYKLTWTILIMLMPLPFTFLYYLTHNGRKMPRYKQKRIDEVLDKYHLENDNFSKLEQVDFKAARQARVIQSTSRFPIYQNTKYTFLKDGAIKFDQMLEEIKQAKKYILIETFILSEGFLLQTLLPILRYKGEQGVEIKIIYDDLGSKITLKNKTIKEFVKIKNCEVANYNPLGLSINPAFNYRDHRKIVIIDGCIAYCGGDNLADEYIHKKDRFGYWRDNCGKFEGEAVKSFISLFIESWYISTKRILPLSEYIVPTNIVNLNSFVLPFGDGPSNMANPGYDVFKSMISSADKTLYISTPYLVIDDSVIEAIALAAKGGVDVRILMPGIPDKKSAFYLARLHYREILKAGGKIYEYSKGFNHAKNIIVDEKYAFIGTMNMDFRSLFLHYECGAIVFLDSEISTMQQDFLEACEESHLVTYEEWQNRPWYQKLIAYIFYLLAPMF